MCNKYGIKESDYIKNYDYIKDYDKSVITLKLDYIKDYDDINLDFSVQK